MSERPRINWPRLWAEAKRDATRDYYADNPEKIQIGHFLGRLRKRAPQIPAMIALIDHEPGNPENKLSTGSVFVASIGREEADPLDVMALIERQPISESEYAYQMARVAWIKKYAPNEPEASPARYVDLKKLPPIGPSE